MSHSHEQLPLPFPHEPAYEESDFLPADCNQQALAWLDRTADWPDGRLALWGEAGRGKTHLLHIWARRTGAIWLKGPALRSPQDLPQTGNVALDDADQVSREVTLFHVLNTARDRRLTLLLAARLPPARWVVSLPDLASRLRAITAVEIGAPDDPMLRALLQRLLADRQLVVAPDVQDWLLLRLPRTPAALRTATEGLDRLSMVDGKRVTRATAARLLAGKDACEDDETSITA